MDFDYREDAQRNFVASSGRFSSNEFLYNLQDNGNTLSSVSKLKDGISGLFDGDVAKKVLSISRSEHPNGPNYPHYFGWRYPNSHQMVPYQMNSFEGRFFSFHEGNGFHGGPPDMLAQGYFPEYQFQGFRYFVVIDFEATCDKEKNPHPQEIIEFPSVIVSSMTGKLEACFQTYVRPTCNQHLSDFCKDLTGIQQSQVDRGVTLSEALLSHDKWLEKKGIKNTNFAVVTWSNWDCRVMLESECRYKKIRKPSYFNRWINLKVPFREVFGGLRCNLREAVEVAGLTWHGRAHCGLDDAKNTASLLIVLLRRGTRLSITNSLTLYDNDCTLISQHSMPPHQPHTKKNLREPQSQYNPCCFCGIKSGVGFVQNPSTKRRSFFFWCGNWAAARGCGCCYFQWVAT
ncbi:3'-5' exoribonuclease 1-like isoform X1 [Rhodamnia argentea]|uniref:3'-5' exoribonuclease 1-like isoform X1 n=1 Tax=Rhodamnia argentea TaxID=178133 RepID=A0ABM3HEV6_9MYRT|nr:3'-5' exoribonuclease 1-like isoform X1 [Rhodamnia argentea]